MEEKINAIKKSWKYLVTGITCAVVGAGITIGADAAKVQQTITAAQAKTAIIQAAQYSAETAVANVSGIATASSKQEAVKTAVAEVTKIIPQFIEAAKAVNEVKTEIATIVKKDEAAVATEVKTDAKEVKKEIQNETNKATTEVKNDVKEVTTKVEQKIETTPATK